jgi:hypothetical protein
MQIVEDEADRIVPHRLDPDHHDVALARHRLALGAAVALDLGRGRGHPKVLGWQLENAAVLERHLQAALVTRQADLGWPVAPAHAAILCAAGRRRI